MTREQPEHSLLLKWLILTGLIFFTVVVAWNEEIMSLLFTVDKSRISWAITFIYLLVTLHCASRVYTLSNEFNLSIQVNNIIKAQNHLSLKLDGDMLFVNKSIHLPDCFTTEYIRDFYFSNKKNNKKITRIDESSISSDLINVYESNLKGPQEIGWFVSDIMLKLGLLGTIIGFIFMLASVSNIANFDVSTMQKILQYMSNGMGTALYTTLTGLICSILSAIQYHMLDRHADELVGLTRHLTQVHIVPKIDR